MHFVAGISLCLPNRQDMGNPFGILPTALRNRVELPVAMKEMRTRMRGSRAPMILLLTTGLIILGVLLLMWQQWDQLAQANDMRHSGQIGRLLFAGLFSGEALICWLIVPALTAGAISLEREQQTLEMLLLTRLSGLNIILGKLLSSLGFIFVILLCALPIAAVSFLFGGVSPAEIAWATAVVLSTTILFGAMGVYCSATFRTTGTAIVLAYGLALAWAFGVLLIQTAASLFMRSFFYTLRTQGGHFNLNFYIEFMYLASFLISAIIPAMLIAAVRHCLLKRLMAHLHILLLWSVLAIMGIVIMLVLFSGTGQGNGPVASMFIRRYQWITFNGNPVSALLALFWSADRAVRMVGWSTWYLPLTLAIQLLLAWAYTVLAAGRLGAMRQEHVKMDR